MTQITEHQLFVTSCYVTYLEDIDNLKITERAFYNEANTVSNERSNQGGYQSLPMLNDQVDCPEVLRLFTKHICPAAQRIVDSWEIGRELTQFSFWYNINRRYSYNSLHTHPHSFVSGVYYAKVPTDSGIIVFNRSIVEIDRLSFQQSHLLNAGVRPDNNRINTEHWFTPTEGMLILFPGHLAHEVRQNLTTDKDDARISLSFNFF